MLKFTANALKVKWKIYISKMHVDHYNVKKIVIIPQQKPKILQK